MEDGGDDGQENADIVDFDALNEELEGSGRNFKLAVNKCEAA